MKVLVVCTANSARSQMAEGILRRIAGDRVEVRSAGTRPSAVHPLAIEAMKEIGLDITGQRSKPLDEFEGQFFDIVITVCDKAKDECPVFPGATKRIHWSVEDPAANAGDREERLQTFRRVRDNLVKRLEIFCSQQVFR